MEATASRAGEQITGHFREAARQSNRHLSRIGRGFSGRRILGSLGGMRVGMHAVGAAAAFAGARMIGLGVNTAAELERAEVGFAGLLGSTEAASDMMRRLKEYAIDTPFNIEGLAPTTQKLLAMGESFGVTEDNVFEFMTVFGNATAALGLGQDAMDRTIINLGQMAGQGKVTAREMRDMANALPGFQPWKVLAEGMGISEAAARDMATNGIIPAEEAIPILLEGMKNIPGAAGAMDRQVKTLGGTLEKFKETMTLALVEGMEPFTESLKELLQNAGFLDTVAHAAESFGEMIANVFDALAPSFEVILNVLADVMDSIGAAFKGFAPIISPVVQLIGVGLTTSFAILSKAMTAMRPAFEAAGKVIDVLADLLGGVLMDALDDLSPMFTALGKVIAVFVETVGQRFLQIVESLVPIFEQFVGILPILVAAFDPLVDALLLLVDAALAELADIIPQIAAAFLTVVQAVAPFLPQLAELIAQLVEALVPVLPLIADLLVQVASVISEALVMALTALMPSLIQLVTMLVEALAPILPQLVQAFIAIVEAILPLVPLLLSIVSKILPPMINLLGLLVKGILAVVPPLLSVIETVAEFVEKVIGWFQELFDTLVGNSIIPDMVNAIIDWFDTLVTIAKAIWNGIKRFIIAPMQAVWDFLVSAWGAIGRFLSSVWDGVKWAVNVAWGLVRDYIIDPIQAAWDFLVDIFGGVVEWISGAWESLTGDVSAVWEGVKDAIIGPVEDAWARIQELAGWIVDKVQWVGRQLSNLATIGRATPGAGGGVLGTVGSALGFVSRWFADGGVVDRPTIAGLGEGGRPEAVIPLTNPGRALSLMRATGLDQLAAGSGGGGGPLVQMNGTVIQDATDADLVAQRTMVAIGATLSG